MPFAVGSRDGVLTLTLDTPGSPVNIFNLETARQLLDVLAGVTAANTRAIVFESAKPESFINGVGLLLAQATRTVDDFVRASTVPWAAYRAVHDAPVPTIAVVQGSCFGCGVEFALNCDYRIASDTFETQFYMTEVHDYLFVPLFGGTWNLPAAVGLSDAIELLLWGARWSSGHALQQGLVDAVVSHEAAGEGVRAFTQRVLDGTQPSRRRGRVAWGPAEEAAVARARARMALLPPIYQTVYGDALALLEQGARQTTSYPMHQQAEVAAAAASTLAPIGKAAQAFFYLRQMASERATGRLGAREHPVTIGLVSDGTAAGNAFVTALGARRVPGVVFVDATVAEFPLLVASSSPAATPEVPGAIVVRPRLAPGPGFGRELHLPLEGPTPRLAELAIGPAMPLDAGARGRLARALERTGFVVALTAATRTFVTTRLLCAYLDPLLRYVAKRGDVGIVNQTLREMGFVRRPASLVAAVDRRALAAILCASGGMTEEETHRTLEDLGQDMLSPSGDDAIGAAVCLSLLAAVLELRAEGAVSHPSIIDLVARELIDFPRHCSSLSAWLKTARVAEALRREREIRSLVADAVLATAATFVDTGREFYR